MPYKMKFKIKYIIVLVLVISTLLCGFIMFKTITNKPILEFETQVYQVENGYGYSIQYHQKTLIKQDFIPVIQKNQSFCNYEDAQKVATLVVEKLVKKQNPRISLQELKNLNIQINCIN